MYTLVTFMFFGHLFRIEWNWNQLLLGIDIGDHPTDDDGNDVSHLKIKSLGINFLFLILVMYYQER